MNSKKDDNFSKIADAIRSEEERLVAALKVMGLIFPDTDDAVDNFTSDISNLAELPVAIKEPKKIIQMAEGNLESETKVIDLGEKRRDLNRYDSRDGEIASAGLFRSKKQTTGEDEKEIAEALKDVAKKLEDEE